MIETALMLSLASNFCLIVYVFTGAKGRNLLRKVIDDQWELIYEQKEALNWCKSLPRDSQGKIK